MNSFKSLLMMLVLGAVGYGVYKTLHEQHICRVTSDIDVSPPEIELKIGEPIEVPATQFTTAPPPDRKDLLTPPVPSLSESNQESRQTLNSLSAVELPKTSRSLPSVPQSEPFASKEPVPHSDPKSQLASTVHDAATASGTLPSIAEPPSRANPSSSAVPPAASLYAQLKDQLKPLLAERKLLDALKMASMLYDNPTLAPNEQQELQELLNQLAGSVIYSREDWLAPSYVVVEGETLESIAKKYQVPQGLLAKINGLASETQPRVGDKVKIVPGPFSAEINLSKKRMTIFLNGCYAGSFEILSLGTESKNYSEQQLKVAFKTDNVAYRSENIPAGDPKNPLGNFLMALSEDIVIHGIGSEVAPNDPRGSIRLSARDVEDAYDILDVGSSVTLKR